MYQKSDKTTITWQDMAQLPVVKGSFLGAAMMTLITPLLNWTNHAMAGKKIAFRHAMAGVAEYASSSMPSYAAVFIIKRLLKPANQQSTPLYELATSFAAGACAGFASTPFDVVALNKLLSASPSKSVRQLIIANNGYSALLRGSGITMFREGMWSMIYLTAAPAVSLYFSNQGMNKNQADASALISTAGTYGMLSTPLNRLRFEKQQNLTEPAPKKSYLDYAKAIWHSQPAATPLQRFGFLFKGVVPRTITAVAGGSLLVKGQELYDELVQIPKPK